MLFQGLYEWKCHVMSGAVLMEVHVMSGAVSMEVSCYVMYNINGSAMLRQRLYCINGSAMLCQCLYCINGSAMLCQCLLYQWKCHTMSVSVQY